MLNRLFSVLDCLRLLDGDPDKPVDEVAVAKAMKVSPRTVYRRVKLARALMKELRRRKIRVTFE